MSGIWIKFFSLELDALEHYRGAGGAAAVGVPPPPPPPVNDGMAWQHMMQGPHMQRVPGHQNPNGGGAAATAAAAAGGRQFVVVPNPPPVAPPVLTAPVGPQPPFMPQPPMRYGQHTAAHVAEAAAVPGFNMRQQQQQPQQQQQQQQQPPLAHRGEGHREAPPAAVSSCF